MATIEADYSRASPDEAIKESLRVIEETLNAEPRCGRGGSFFEVLGTEFRRLHARIRAHHGMGSLNPQGPAGRLPLEVQNEWSRLRDEHPRILGQLDWLIRHVDSVADQCDEDYDVFVLRARELIAVLRRHDAEEDRVLAMAIWYETGGES